MTVFPDPQATAVTFTAHEERGWWPGAPSDPHPTLNGVTQETYTQWRTQHGLPDQSVHDMSPSEQTAIYEGYWRACQAATVATYSGPLAVCHFDAAFNAGAHRAALLLQETVGASQDGDLGPLTWLKVQETCAENEPATVEAYLQNRWSFLQRLSNFAAWKQVWGGRENRLAVLCGVNWTVS